MATRYFALLTAQGTACLETVLSEAEYNNRKIRDSVEDNVQSDMTVDSPVIGTWTDVTDNDLIG